MGRDDDQLNQDGSQPQGGDDQNQMTDADRGGLSADEWAIMQDMQNSGDPGAVDPGDGDGEPPGDTGQQPPAQQKQADPNADGDDDDDTDEPPAQLGKDGKPVQQEPGTQPRQKRVSFAKFKAAQDEAEALRKRVQDQEVTQAKLKERLDIMAEAWRTPGASVPVGNGAQQPGAPQQPQAGGPVTLKVPSAEELIDPNVDIFGAFAQMQKLAMDAVQTVATIQTQQQTDAQDREISNAYVEDAKEFLAREPTFLLGYQHLMDTRAEQLAQMWFQKSARADAPLEQRVSKAEFGKIKQAMAREEKQLVREAIQNQRSPAEVIFNLAKTFQFNPEEAKARLAGTQQADPAAAQQQQQQPTLADIAAGRASAPGAAAQQPAAGTRPTAGATPPAVRQPTRTVADEVADLQRNVAASTSLSQGNGAPASTITTEFIAKMNDQQFAEWMETATPEQMEAVMGS